FDMSIGKAERKTAIVPGGRVIDENVVVIHGNKEEGVINCDFMFVCDDEESGRGGGVQFAVADERAIRSFVKIGPVDLHVAAAHPRVHGIAAHARRTAAARARCAVLAAGGAVGGAMVSICVVGVREEFAHSQ